MIKPDMDNPKKMLDSDKILAMLRDMLPSIAHDLISSRQDISDPLQQTFEADPDNPAEHSPLWHQYGILTHSKQFQEIVKSDLPRLVVQWGISHQVETALSEKIQGTSKSDLLQVASLLHDLGKFTARTFERQEDGTLLAKFVGHEVDSGAIVRGGIKHILQQLGLRDQQIEYIAHCAEHHFDLGKARQVAIDNGGYTIAYARSDAFKDVALEIMDTTPELAIEIGLMFIADSLSKTEVMATADTDEGIKAQKLALEQEIEQKGLDYRLINQALQQPVNVEIGKQYLKLWADTRAI